MLKFHKVCAGFYRASSQGISAGIWIEVWNIDSDRDSYKRMGSVFLERSYRMIDGALMETDDPTVVRVSLDEEYSGYTAAVRKIVGERDWQNGFFGEIMGEMPGYIVTLGGDPETCTLIGCAYGYDWRLANTKDSWGGTYIEDGVYRVFNYFNL